MGNMRRREREDYKSKSAAIVTEPASWKVSCVGKVRDKRSIRRSNSVRSEKSMENCAGRCTNQKTGFYSILRSIFRFGKAKQKQARSRSRRVAEEPEVDELPRRTRGLKSQEITERAEPPILGGMKRFSSGRRSESFTSDDSSLDDACGVDRNRGGSRRKEEDTNDEPSVWL